MQDQTLSVCLIVKDESKNIDRCLSSVIDVADEIVVVDTGSTDNTVQLARAYGEKVKVIEYEWKNDFSDARNKSLEHATKDWILFLDADEELPLSECQKVKYLFNNQNNKQFEGYYVRLVNFADGNELGDSIVFRIFKNDPDYRFTGKMHEQVINAVQGKGGVDSVGSTDIRIYHYGYDPNVADQSKKCERNINLLLSYEEKDKDGYYYYALGNEYCRMGTFDKSIETFNTSIKRATISNGEMPIYYPYLMVSLMNILFHQRRFKEELEYIQMFKKTCRDFKDLHLNEGLIYTERCSFSKSKKSFTKYLECEKMPTNYSYPSNNYDQYNIPSVMEKLNEACVEHDDNLLSSVIICDKYTQTIVETLKSLNELSREVIIVLSKDISIDTTELENMGAIIVKSKSNNENEMYFDALIKCKGKYILKINLGEVFSNQAQKDIVEILKNNKKDVFEVDLINMQNIVIGRDVRLFKNNKRFKKYVDFQKHINSKKIESIDLKIHNVYDINQEQINLDNQSTTEDDSTPSKVLIASLIDINIENFRDFLIPLSSLNTSNLSIGYYFVNNSLDSETQRCLYELQRDVADIFVADKDSINIDEYKTKAIEYCLDKEFDYIMFVDCNTKLNKDDLQIFINSHNNIIMSTNSTVFISRESILSGVDFQPITVLPNIDDSLNLQLKAEILNIEIAHL